MMEFITAEPDAPISIARFPPILSVSGPLMRNENAYVIVPAAKMMPKASFDIRSPSAFLDTVRLYRAMYRNAYVRPSGSQLIIRRRRYAALCPTGLRFVSIEYYRVMEKTER